MRTDGGFEGRLRAAMAIAIATTLLAGARPAAADDANAAPDSAPNAAPGRAGQWIHVDPQTGQRVPPPPAAGRAAVPVDPAFSTSHAGLAEHPAPGGGMMVDLQGRFRSAATATVGADGKADLDCVPPGTAAGKE